jgi:hypothetical protein
MHVSKRLPIAAAVAIAALSAPPAAAVAIFDDRAAFAAAAGPLLTDDYEDPGYAEFQDDASMNAVKGLTRYESTFFPDFDEVIDFGGQHVYAGGFTSGSFRLDFTAASLGGAGVHAVGFDFVNNLTAPYVAFVTFADGTSENFTLAASPFTLPPLPDFFGLTSPIAITAIHIGLADGGATADNLFTLDNLSVSAPVPEPGSAALLGTGLAAFALVRRRHSDRCALHGLRFPAGSRRARTCAAAPRIDAATSSNDSSRSTPASTSWAMKRPSAAAIVSVASDRTVRASISPAK